MWVRPGAPRRGGQARQRGVGADGWVAEECGSAAQWTTPSFGQRLAPGAQNPGAWRRGALEPLPNPPWWCYNNAMTLTARVQNGRLVLDEPTMLPEGAEVTLQMIDGDDLDEQERVQLLAAIEEGLDDAEAGRVISMEESLAEIRALRCALR